MPDDENICCAIFWKFRLGADFASSFLWFFRARDLTQLTAFASVKISPYFQEVRFLGLFAWRRGGARMAIRTYKSDYRKIKETPKSFVRS